MKVFYSIFITLFFSIYIPTFAKTGHKEHIPVETSENSLIWNDLVRWNSFLGSGRGIQISSDSSGNSFVVGIIGSDIMVAKSNVEGTLLWRKLLGSGSGWGIDIDNNGNVYISGSSSSTWGSPRNAHSSGNDLFIAKLDTNGNLLWNTFYPADCGVGKPVIELDGAGNIYLTGGSNSSWGTPVNPYSTGQEIFVAKFDGEGILLWNTFQGSTSSDFGAAIGVDSEGFIYVSGVSSNSWGAPLGIYNSGAFVSKFDNSGNFIWNRFLGGTGTSWGQAIDGDNNIYVTGSSNRSWGDPINTYFGGTDCFIVKLNSSGTILWNTFLGGPGTDTSDDIVLDSNGNIFIAGGGPATWGKSLAVDGGGASDMFVAELDVNGHFKWNTFLGGGSSSDYANDIAIDDEGNLFITGENTGSWGNPTGSYSSGVPVVRLRSSCSVEGKVSEVNSNIIKFTVDVKSFGLSNPVATGVCWNESGKPDIGDRFINKGGRIETGAFTTWLEKLKPATTYYLRAFAKNRIDESFGDEVLVSYSDEVVVKTDNLAAPPILVFNNYSDGMICAGIISPEVSVDSHYDMLSVNFYLDGEMVGEGTKKEGSDNVYSFDIDTSKYMAGNYNLKVVATDIYGQKGEAEIQLMFLSLDFNLSASRKELKTLLYRKEYGNIEIALENGDKEFKFVLKLMVKEEAGAYKTLKEFEGADLEKNLLKYQHRYLKKGVFYNYKLELYNSEGELLKTSKEIEI